MTSEPLSSSQRTTLERAAQTYHEAMDDRTREYLSDRGLLGVASSLRFGTVVVPDPEHRAAVGRLSIPYLGPRGNVYYMKFRCIEPHDCGDLGHSKYLNISAKLRPYNVRALTAPTDYLFVTEGELDAATLEACGWPAIGVAGVEDWKAHYPRMLAGFNRTVLLADGDPAGERLATKFMDTMPSGASVIVCETGQDVNSIFREGGKPALEQLIRGAK